MFILRGSFENISVRNLDQYIWKERCLIIDLRDENEYLTGHIQNALNIPYEKIANGEYNFSKDYELILYCGRGGLSILAAKQLCKAGYIVKTVVGGLNAYNGRCIDYIS